MNLALGTFLLFLLIIPGISFRASYFFGALTKKISRSSAFDDFIWGIIPGITFQLIGSIFVNYSSFIGYQINFLSLGKILFSSSEASKEFGNIQETLPQILLYNTTLISFAALSGYTLRKIIRFFHLDHMCKVFRFNNEWFYLMKGEYKFFAENLSEEDAIDMREQVENAWIASGKKNFLFIWRLHAYLNRNKHLACTIHAVVKVDKDNPYIYTGILDSFYLLKDGSLDNIILKQPQRRKFFDSPEKEPEAYDIPTGIIILKNEHITNINVSPLYFFPYPQEVASVESLEENKPLSIDELKEKIELKRTELESLNSQLTSLRAEIDQIEKEDHSLSEKIKVAKELEENSEKIELIKTYSEALENNDARKKKVESELSSVNKKINFERKNLLMIESELKVTEANSIIVE